MILRHATSLAALAFATVLPPVISMALPTSAAMAAEATDADRKLQALYNAEWPWRMKEFARSADPDGGRAKASDHLPSVTAASQQKRYEYWTGILKQLDAIPVDQLSHEEKINAAVFRESIWAMAMNIRYKTYEAPFNSDTFFWGGLNPRTPYSNAEDYRLYLSRMKDVPRYFDENIVNMKAGIKRGYTVPRVSIEGRDKTIEAFVSPGTDNPFYDAFRNMPDTIPADQRQALQAEAQAAIRDSVAPAYAKLLAFMRTEYMPKARKTIDAYSLPDGKAFYQDQIKEYTTLDYTPQQIHEIGLKEVARIDADMKQTMKDAKWNGTFKEFLTFLRTDPQFYAKTPKELLSLSAYVVKKMDGKLKDTFNLLPRYRFTILPVPDAIAPIYTSGRGGLDSCLMNTYELPSRPLYSIPALTLHECNPGHSFQAAYALEAPDRPIFRGQTYFSGYGEGWGLYTEWLGKKMGIYESPYEEFGRQTFEMWRAVRLVIDTGMHSMGWTRQQAIDYMTEHTALAPLDIQNEVDRYIAWPGQALAYKLGEISIRNLRAEAEKELGDKFDQRPFHDTLLGMGSVPLTVMEAEMRAFIAREKAKHANAAD
ncbi:DUF885 domain-containing protein [Sphingobium lignivorans]|uniref:Uncharacterized protein (DUF885 family) n=1 Tax=Sphingobium lignivorans TaxID=2735886 RepID=A0ABR6NEZ7_9SPHN|nr:DUF885 family protein [Sphingobium lignivorans]MBB5985864.1 uncharacterized protein (DUF885 family) [Sphingobium lignivorans]